MSGNLYLKNALIIDPKTKYKNQGNLLIESGKILDFGAEVINVKNYQEIDCNGKALIPGLVDIQVHFVILELRIKKIS